MHQKVLILDFGSQYTQLIARRIREANVYCEIHPFNLTLEKIQQLKPKGIILSGGPASVYQESAPKAEERIFSLPIPFLGICYGMGLINQAAGGEVARAERREYGSAELFVDDDTDLFHGFPHNGTVRVWMSHGDRMISLPKGWRILAHSRNSPIASFANPERKLFGVQFHPEVVHTPKGIELIKNFVYVVCGVKPTWTTKNFIDEQVKLIREKVGKEKVLLALSGGVDSTTVAALLHKAIGDQLTCMFIDQGFMRKNEAAKIESLFLSKFKINFIHINAAEKFFNGLKGVADPEEKRKIIGENFIRTFETEAKKLGDIPYLGQGTLYPDVIESAVPGTTTGKVAKKIKTHHNVGGLPEKMNLKLIEPLRELYKDEVRQIGRMLGLHRSVTERQPFPGPSLAVRIIGEVTKERADTLRQADAIVCEEVEKSGIKIQQYFAVLPSMRSVGVQGDARTYGHPIIIRALTSKELLTVDWARLPHELLAKISTRITNEVKGINRVVYDITSKPPGTVEWE